VGAGRGQAGRSAGGGPLTPCARIAVQLDPRWFIATRASVYDLIAVAYGYRCPTPDVIVGGPVWIRSEMYDIQALIPTGTPTYTRMDLAEGNAPKLQKMLQHLLAKRFNLSLRRESKEFLGYNLTLVNSAKLKLSEDQPGATRAAQPASDEPIFFSGNSSLASYAALLQGQMGRPVDDKTGLKGLYDFAIPMPEINDPLPPGDVAHEASLRIMELLPRKLEQHLGLRLESTSTTVDSIVIEHVDKPTEN